MTGAASGLSAKLAVTALNAAYGRAHILYDVALAVGAGEAVALIGRNGAGKSTTMRAIVGLIANCSGNIIFDGSSISHLPTHERVRRGLGYVPEDRRIFSDLTVNENLDVGRQARRRTAQRAAKPDQFIRHARLHPCSEQVEIHGCLAAGRQGQIRCGDQIVACARRAGHVEIKLKPHADAQSLLREAVEKAKIYKFELVEPSLEEIFIQTVGEKIDA